MSDMKKTPFRFVKMPKPERRNNCFNTTNGSIILQHKTISFDEKREIMNSIQNELTTFEFNNIVQIIETNQPDVLQSDATSYEFDLQDLNDSTLSKLKCYIANCLSERSTGDDIRNRSNICTANSIIRTDQKQRSLRSDLNKRIENSFIERIELRTMNQSALHNEYQCQATKKLRSKVCYICGLASKSYNITDHLKRQYQSKFDLELKVDKFTPDTICGTCRSNLTSNQKGRKFQFSKPMIWRPATTHLNLTSDTDCYFCIVERNVNFFKNKNRLNLPQTSNCSLPKFSQHSKSKFKGKRSVSNVSDQYEYNNQNGYVMNSQDFGQSGNENINQVIDQFINQKNLRSSAKETLIDSLPLLNSMNNSSDQNTETIYSRLDQTQMDLNAIKEQQQIIINSINILTSFVMLFCNLNNRSTGDQLDRDQEELMNSLNLDKN